MVGYKGPWAWAGMPQQASTRPTDRRGGHLSYSITLGNFCTFLILCSSLPPMTGPGTTPSLPKSFNLDLMNSERRFACESRLTNSFKESAIYSRNLSKKGTPPLWEGAMKADGSCRSPPPPSPHSFFSCPLVAQRCSFGARCWKAWALGMLTMSPKTPIWAFV